METKSDSRYFRTTSLPLAVFLYAKDQQIAGINSTNSPKKEFVFVLSDYWRIWPRPTNLVGPTTRNYWFRYTHTNMHAYPTRPAQRMIMLTIQECRQFLDAETSKSLDDNEIGKIRDDLYKLARIILETKRDKDKYGKPGNK